MDKDYWDRAKKVTTVKKVKNNYFSIILKDLMKVVNVTMENFIKENVTVKGQ